ncbi:MAG: hypothetical protein WAN46_17990, partial [Gammaproteobacteria bacterium]
RLERAGAVAVSGPAMVATGAGIGAARWRLRASRQTAGNEAFADEFHLGEVRKKPKLLTRSTDLDP